MGHIADDSPVRIWFGTGEILDLASDPPIEATEDGVGPMVDLTRYVTSMTFKPPDPSWRVDLDETPGT